MKLKNAQEWIIIFISVAALVVSIVAIIRPEAISKKQYEAEALQLAYDAWDLLAGEKGALKISSIEQPESKLEEAKRLFSRAILLAEDSPEVIRRYGVFLGATREYENSLKMFDKAKELSPLDARIYLNIGIVNLIVENHEVAKDNFLRAIELGKADNMTLADAYEGLGSAYYKLGFEEKAVTSYRNALEINQDHPVAKYNLEWLQQNIHFNN